MGPYFVILNRIHNYAARVALTVSSNSIHVPEGTVDYWQAKSCVTKLLCRVPCFTAGHADKFAQDILDMCSKTVEQSPVTTLLRNTTFTWTVPILSDLSYLNLF